MNSITKNVEEYKPPVFFLCNLKNLFYHFLLAGVGGGGTIVGMGYSVYYLMEKKAIPRVVLCSAL